MNQKLLSIQKTPSQLWLCLAIILFGCATPLLKALVSRGGFFGEVLQNAISFCNVLFVGNLLSALLVFVLFRPQRILTGIRTLSSRLWLLLLGNTLLANVLAPALVIMALEVNTATSVVLLLQTDIIFLAIVGRIFYGDKVSGYQWAGYLLIATGSILLAMLSQSKIALIGVLCVIVAAALRALGNAAARNHLATEDTLPAFLFLRNLIGAVCFFFLALQMYGSNHFAEAFLPGLWQLMIIYAAFIIVLAQLSWYRAIAALPGKTVATGWILTPIVSLIVAYLALGEVPTQIQWLSVGFIISGLAIAQLGNVRSEHRSKALINTS